MQHVCKLIREIDGTLTKPRGYISRHRAYLSEREPISWNSTSLMYLSFPINARSLGSSSRLYTAF
eukprot:scaffold7233_cov570-Prasinococcus_capsulatus_cf.AAC.8